ncbi:MAG: hypothetical protein ACTSYU_11755 [Promethearchaeota archaeon]
MSTPNKDNLTNATSTSQIDWYFDLQNPTAKKRHIMFFSVSVLNVFQILFAIILNTDGYTLILWIGLIVVLILMTFYMMWRKYSYYRFIIYLFAFGGIFTSVFLTGRYPLLYIAIIVTSIFLIHFVSIEVSLQRHLNYFARGARMKNFNRFGRDNFEKQ